ncbi:NAD-dependent epimerase/dehydratase family protein [Halocatena salina]|uniref:NAD(P)-dependent oxidoreductase n=1 Tax=Halocatena salina TaxID=2934340 RepID=A0A8U0A610_9EURY|nr:NAD(P)-dependent oxidoreductase [Halocatena salina]UPM44289.1 NAD(P)-dependent oxidoreductase [Halocatena salina]
MDVLMTGAYGRCGTAVIDHLHDGAGYDFTYLNRSDRPDGHPYGDYETIVADVADRDALVSAADGRDAMVHMAAYPFTDGGWDEVFEPNIIGMYNALEAARTRQLESFVFISSNHAVGMYEQEFAPEIYATEFDLTVDHTDPVRPDSFYGVSKCFGEALGRYYVENYEYPRRFYALRVGTVNMPPYDHPYGDAEQGVADGAFERDSAEYDRAVTRMKALWQSRRDFAHQVDCCLQNETVEYGTFYGVSDNRRRWFDIEHARDQIGYDPQDDGERWNGPPE